MASAKSFGDYIGRLRDNLSLGNATEHTHRPAFKALLETGFGGITATNEPSHIECGAPDFCISQKGTSNLTVGYIELKDVGVCLDDIQRDSQLSEPLSDNGSQLKRYREALPNLILSNYTEFYWYVDGELRAKSALCEQNEDNKLTEVLEGIESTDVLLQSFIDRNPIIIDDPYELAQRMARITHMIRSIMESGFEREQTSQIVEDLFEVTRQSLIPELDTGTFSDMFAQTLAYGLFAARANRPKGEFRRADAAYDIPTTNPFVRGMLSIVVSPALDAEPFTNFVDDLVQLLSSANMKSIVDSFAERTRQDPVLHFYETFLSAYDPDLRVQRGVYYTPEPVVSYIVRSVDAVLKNRFQIPDGLADYAPTTYQSIEPDDGGEQTVEKQSHRVLVLDPACGTGSFLYAVINHIREHINASGRKGMWSQYVSEHLLKRVFGFELLMAPYAMAHLKLGMQLAALDLPEDEREDWDCDFSPGDRLGVYLTNALEDSNNGNGMLGPFRILSDEATAAAEIKRDLPIMVVLGNPPYAGHSANLSRRNGKLTWIGRLIEDYRVVNGQPLGERNPKWLQDDYVKFIRFGQWRIDQSGKGVLAFITNHRYLDNPTFKGMRASLMRTFDDIFILDLHGSLLRKERSESGEQDQNVFDIQPGVAISIFIKDGTSNGTARVHRDDLYGSRDFKFNALSSNDVSTTEWRKIEPRNPSYFFQSWDSDLEGEYAPWYSVADIFPVNSVGVVTGQDDLAVQWTDPDMRRVARDFARSRIQTYEGDLVVPILYRFFDNRFTYYEDTMITRRRWRVMQHMLAGPNVGLITCRQQSEADVSWNLCGISRSVIESCAISNNTSEINYMYPLYLYPSKAEIDAGLYESDDRRPNLSAGFIAELESELNLTFGKQDRGDLEVSFGPDDVLNYIYSILHSSTYRSRYQQFLRADFPSIPIPNDLRLFRQLVDAGQELARLHLLESSSLSRHQVRYPMAGDNVVDSGYPRYYAPGDIPPNEPDPISFGRVYINRRNQQGVHGQYFEGVDPETWSQRAGAYRPLEKWLRDRRGRNLTFDEIDRYSKIYEALRRTRLVILDVESAISESGTLFS